MSSGLSNPLCSDPTTYTRHSKSLGTNNRDKIKLRIGFFPSPYDLWSYEWLLDVTRFKTAQTAFVVLGSRDVMSSMGGC